MSDQQDVPLAPVFGSFYFAAVMSTTFYGVACMQTFFYYTHYQGDPLRTKVFVAIQFVLNTMHEVLTVVGTYKYIVTGVMTQGAFVDGLPELTTQMLLTALVGVPIQGFFVYRIYLISKKKIAIPIIWVPLGIYQLVACFIYVSTATPSEIGRVPFSQTFVLNKAFNKDIFLSGASVIAVVDLLIALCMCYLLLRERTHQPKFRSTALVLHRLAIFAVNSGMWTAIFAILSAVLMYVLPSREIFSVFSTPICSVYCNTLLANLNARAYIKMRSTHNVDTDMIPMSTAAFGDAEGNAQP